MTHALFIWASHAEDTAFMLMYTRRPTYCIHEACASLGIHGMRCARMNLAQRVRHARGTPTDVAGTGEKKGGMKDDVARLVETLPLGSVGQLG